MCNLHLGVRTWNHSAPLAAISQCQWRKIGDNRAQCFDKTSKETCECETTERILTQASCFSAHVAASELSYIFSSSTRWKRVKEQLRQPSFPHTRGVSCEEELSAALLFARATRNVPTSEENVTSADERHLTDPWSSADEVPSERKGKRRGPVVLEIT